jgi:hypothetical protein
MLLNKYRRRYLLGAASSGDDDDDRFMPSSIRSRPPFPLSLWAEALAKVYEEKTDERKMIAASVVCNILREGPALIGRTTMGDLN